MFLSAISDVLEVWVGSISRNVPKSDQRVVDCVSISFSPTYWTHHISLGVPMHLAAP